jgi:glutaminyl-peptide cyclotransferase
MKKIFYLISFGFLAACNNGSDSSGDDIDPDIIPATTPLIPYRVIAQHPHDTGAYTQGLQLYQGKLYEGTGDYETSSLRITDWKTGKVEKKHMMGSDKIFGEGITILNGLLYQLTWQNKLVYVYDIRNIEKPLKSLQWPFEGWGMTNNGTELIISDGSSNLYFVNPADMKVRNTISVTDSHGPIRELNELEYIDGYVYANVYQTPFIIKIDPESGQVKGKMILENLLTPADVVPGRTDVLNGIAYDSSSKTMLITGKRWPKLFEIKL